MLVPHGKPLLGDFRARAGLTLAACAIVTVGLGLLFVGQTVPDGLDNAVDSRVIAFFAGQETLLGWLAAPGTLIPAIAVSVATAAGLPDRRAAERRGARGDRRPRGHHS